MYTNALPITKRLVTDTGENLDVQLSGFCEYSIRVISQSN